MRLRRWILGALFCAAAAQAQDGTRERSSTLNNTANRAAAAAQAPSEHEEFEQVPGGPATSKKDWSKGDPRGKPQNPADYPQARRGKKHRKASRRPKAQP